MQVRDQRLVRDAGYVNGRWVQGIDGSCFSVEDPATGREIAQVARFSAQDAHEAIDAANNAFSDWRATPAVKRSALLLEWARLIRENIEDLGTILSSEQGKPTAEAQSEIGSSAAFIEWFAEESKRVYGDIIPAPSPDRRSLVLKEPIGVCVGITPWNFPSSMIARKVAPALAAGCTMVLKPAEQTPLSALALAELADRAGIPAGVLNVVPTDAVGAPEIGKEFTQNPIIRKLSFTGSTEVGKLLIEQCASTVKKVSLELGGSAPFIVFADADLDEAIAGLIGCKFRNAGQTCISANRILVQAEVYDEFASRLVNAISSLEPGAASDGASIGPLIDRDGLSKVERHVTDAIEKGARVLAGGGQPNLGGTFFAPTVLTGVTRDMLLMHEETFGPVAGLLRFETEAEAIEIANDTPYGLASYFYSRDIGRVWRVSEGLQFGMVGANSGMVAGESTPFGGVKASGIGREGSKYGIDDWVEIKYVAMGGLI
jgi:succinate-semialdehyde dehydrogenase/glutarate-semialdehyde dehydrogenase